MATGELEPTWGDIELSGSSIFTAHDFLFQRAAVGICFQENALFPALTVREHIDLIMGLKFNANDTEKALYAERLMRKLDLTKEANKLSSALSGGNKRKASLFFPISPVTL